jgi:DNA-binding NarL/FixJ family response regulator
VAQGGTRGVAASKGEPVTLLVVAGEELFRRGLSALLAAEPGLEVVGEVNDTASAAALAARIPVDVVLMDYDGAGILGVERLASIRDRRGETPRAVVLVADGHVVGPSSPSDGSGDFLSRGCALEELVAAVRASGRSSGASAATSAPPRRLGGVSRALTTRQLEVLCLVAQGLNNRDVAEALFLAENTVKNHVRNILAKLGVRTRVQAAVLAVREGLIDPAELLTSSSAPGPAEGHR